MSSVSMIRRPTAQGASTGSSRSASASKSPSFPVANVQWSYTGRSIRAPSGSAPVRAGQAGSSVPGASIPSPAFTPASKVGTRQAM